MGERRTTTEERAFSRNACVPGGFIERLVDDLADAESELTGVRAAISHERQRATQRRDSAVLANNFGAADGWPLVLSVLDRIEAALNTEHEDPS